MESSALSLFTSIISAIYVATPSPIHKARVNTAATYTPLALNTNKLFIRADNGNPDTIINIFNSDGSQLYSIERNSARSTQWIIYTSVSRDQVAAIKVGLMDTHVNYLKKPNLRHQAINGTLTQRFNLNDGTSYEWTRGTRLLERISNPGGGREEVHERLGQVNLLRRTRFDWELLVDRHFDAEIALCTAFVAMRTIWSRIASVSSPNAVA